MARKSKFSPAIKVALAERAGFVCSFPSCGAPTIGPSEETPTSSANTGMACHIHAAADGPAARRIDPHMSTAQLSSIENGVWMCYRHGKLIDTDECTYTPEQLRAWRRLAERCATLRHALGREPTPEELASEHLAMTSLQLTTPMFINEIVETLELSMFEIVWGKHNALTARDLIIEIARNALTHGRASYFVLKVRPHSIELVDDGQPFSLVDLRNSSAARGGAMALSQATQRAPHVVHSYLRDGARNVIELAFSGALDEVLREHPCSTTVYGGKDSVDAAVDFINSHPGCGTIFLRPKFGILSYSDLYNLAAVLRTRSAIEHDIALVMQPHSQGIREFLAKELPAVRLIEAPFRR